ncbi:hypothetical protein [Chryseobacterium foetidum]|uniref:hypothetical protein n=1 Tax=Chryseobacterium foetidum TaxID=2951057 RepID=UPI0021C70596|nr:hypothetical protein [Chryseobacterium foetidum]
MVRIIYLLLFSVSLLSCSKNTIDKVDTFGYSGLQNSFDSESGVYTRRYWGKTKEIKISLTADEKVCIIKHLKELNMKDTIDCSDGTKPQMYLKITINGKHFTCITSPSESLFCPGRKSFNKAYNYMRHVVESKKSVKDMPDSNIYYE